MNPHSVKGKGRFCLLCGLDAPPHHELRSEAEPELREQELLRPVDALSAEVAKFLAKTEVERLARAGEHEGDVIRLFACPDPIGDRLNDFLGQSRQRFAAVSADDLEQALGAELAKVVLGLDH